MSADNNQQNNPQYNQQFNPQTNQTGYAPVNMPVQKAKKPVYKKWWFWLIIVLVIFFIIGAFSGGDEQSGTKESQGVQSSSNVQASEDNKDPNVVGDYRCEVVKATRCKDYQGKSAVKITYSFTNNAQEPASFDIALIDEVYQDGVQLESAILGMDEDVDYGVDVKIKNGVTKDVVKVYTLRDDTTPLDIEISEFASFDDEKITTKIELQ